jgi:hypothetical protein
MSQEKRIIVSENPETRSKQIPAMLSFSERPWGLLVNGALIDDKSEIEKKRVETGTTKQVFILKTKIPLQLLLPQRVECNSTIVHIDERG